MASPASPFGDSTGQFQSNLLQNTSSLISTKLKTMFEKPTTGITGLNKSIEGTKG
jgi:hypothetical protein